MSGRGLVDAYLAELAAAAEALPAGRRTELIGDVREHIETALDSGGAADEVAVRNVLDRLGSPAEIVSADMDADPPHVTRDLPAPAPAGGRGALTPTRVVIAVLTGVVVLLLAVISGTMGPAAAVMAVAFAVMTPFVWIPLAVALIALAVRRERGAITSAPGNVGGTTGSAASRRPSPSLVGLGAIGVVLLVALVAAGAGYMGMVAVLMLPVVALLLVLEVVRSRRG